MKIMIEIPDKDIPERQDIISVDLCFVGRKVGQCTYPFEILTQEPIEVLQEIRQEIEKTVSRYAISRERGAMGQVEWSDRLIKESDVFGIIDRYIDQYKEEAG